VGVRQLRLFHHTRYAGVALVQRAWDTLGVPAVLAAAGIVRRGHAAPALAFAQVLKPLVDARSQQPLVARCAGDELVGATCGPLSQPACSRFLNTPRFAWPALTARVSAHRQTRPDLRTRRSGLLILDDTILEKAGRAMEGLQKLYDTAKQRFVRGYGLVYSTDRRAAYPLGYRPTRRRGRPPKQAPRGKIALALALLHEARAAGGRARAVVFDAWYCALALLKTCDALGLPFVTRARRSRCFVVDGRRVSARTLMRRRSRFRRSPRRGLAVYWTPAELPGYGPVALVIVRRDGARSPQVLVSNLLRTDWAEILALYERRWDIEPFFREGKQALGLNAFHEHSLQGIEGALTFACLTAVLLAAIARLVPATRGYTAEALRAHLMAVTALLVYTAARLELLTDPRAPLLVTALTQTRRRRGPS
jgi:hypothetical protein